MFNKYFRLFLIWVKNLLDFAFLINYVIQEDRANFSLKLNQYKKIYFSLSIFKHLLIIFLLITGVVPLFLFINMVFFFFKYLFKYSFLTIDYFLDSNNKYYLSIKKFVYSFFIIIPTIISKIFIYLFGGGWIRFFLDKLKIYFINKWYSTLSNFYRITDNFLLIYVPKKIANLREKTQEFYYIFILSFFKSKGKAKVKLKGNKRKIYKKVRRLSRALKLLNRSYSDLYRRYYYILYFKYIRAYCHWAWIFRKFIWSDMLNVTIEAFSYIAFWDLIACFIYIKKLIYTRLEYYLMILMMNISRFIIVIGCYKDNLVEYLKYLVRVFIGNFKRILLRLLHSFLFNLTILLSPLIFHDLYFWYWLKDEFYEIDKGYRSFMWFNVKFYSVIQKFFRRLKPTPIRLYIFNKRFDKILWYITIKYYFTLISRRIIEQGYYNYFDFLICYMI